MEATAVKARVRVREVASWARAIRARGGATTSSPSSCLTLRPCPTPYTYPSTSPSPCPPPCPCIST